MSTLFCVLECTMDLSMPSRGKYVNEMLYIEPRRRQVEVHIDLHVRLCILYPSINKHLEMDGANQINGLWSIARRSSI